MPKKIVGVSGSPRKNGNSEILLDAVLESAARAGAAVKKISVRDLQFSPCIGCGSCEKTGVCVFKDDMNDIVAEVMDADCVVLSAPMYFMNMPGKMKSFMDRFQTVWSRKYVLKENLRPDGRTPTGYVIGVGGTGVKDLFDGYNLTAKVFYFILDIKFDRESSLYYYRVETRGEIKSNPEAIREAEALGEKMALLED